MTAVNARKSTSAGVSGVFPDRKEKEGKQRKIPLNNNMAKAGQRGGKGEERINLTTIFGRIAGEAAARRETARGEDRIRGLRWRIAQRRL